MGIIIVLDTLFSVQGLVELVDLMDNNHSMELEQLNICQKFIHTITFSGSSQRINIHSCSFLIIIIISILILKIQLILYI